MSLLRLSGVGVWLIALWLLLWNDVSVANVVSGVAVAALVLAGARLPKVVCAGDTVGDRARIAPLSLLYFVGYVIVKLVQSNLVLAWEIVTPNDDRIRTGIVAVPMRTDSELAMLVVSSVITLTPGTITIDASGTPPVIYVNVLHLHDIEDVRRELLHIEELSVRAFGSRTARAQLAAARADGGEVVS